jgi:hypothetical protein
MRNPFERLLWACGALVVLVAGGLLLTAAEADGAGATGISIGGVLLFGFCARQALRGL